MTSKRILYLDAIRVMACCMIILMHSPHPHAGNPNYVVVPISFLTAAGIGLFFMVSGALLLPAQMSTLVFLRKRISKVIFPTLFWTFFYLTISYLWDEKSLSEIGKAFISIPFSVQGHGVLWFMYTLIGLYLLAPIISPFLISSNQKTIRFYLIVWGITLCYPWLKIWLGIDESPTGILYYFAGYAGYFVLGYYLKTYERKLHPILSLLLIVVPLMALAVYAFTGHEQWQSSGRFWYLSIFVVMMCVGWFNLAKELCDWQDKRLLESINGGGGEYNFLVTFSNCGFGIYLMHIFIMRYILWGIDFVVYGLGGIGQIIMTWLLTLAISFLLTYAISYLPFSEYIIGFHHKRKK